MAEHLEPNFHFRLMSWMYRVRDLFGPRKNLLKEAGLKEGFQVLDYGCGPGSYIIPEANLIGPAGKIYALDVHPLALEMVKKRAAKGRLVNVTTIQSDGRTGLPGQSLDVGLLYDVFHDLEQPGRVLKELHRVLKPGAILSFSDHHLQEAAIISAVTKDGLFRLANKGKKTYTFQKVG
jgi:ubiquinone/menaquinone biosynthesis C-methylase UbiE